MQAVILAAGKGARMGDLTKDTPKPLLVINGKTLLEYKLDVLPDKCNEVIIVIGYLGDKIQKHIGHQYKNKKITYVHSELLGTGYALWKTQEYLFEEFLVMSGDDLYCRQDIENCMKYSPSILVFRSKTHQDGGKVVMNEGGYIENIVEGSHDAGSIVSTGLYFLNESIFDLPLKKISDDRDEFGLPQTLIQMKDKNIRAIYAMKWHQITTPKDLEISEEELLHFI